MSKFYRWLFRKEIRIIELEKHNRKLLLENCSLTIKKQGYRQSDLVGKLLSEVIELSKYVPARRDDVGNVLIDMYKNGIIIDNGWK